MNCHELELRLYDEDCRHALLGEAPVPGDVAAHIESCPACRKAWSGAAVDTVRLTRDLLLEAPPSVTVPAFSGESTGPSLGDIVGWGELGWAITAGALLAGLGALFPGSTPLWQWTGFWIGAACGLTAALLDNEGVALFPGWA